MEINYTQLANDCVQWIKDKGIKKAIVGISGGKDSTVVATLLVKALGRENVFGLLMPCGPQKDIADAYRVVNYLDIPFDEIDIKGAYNEFAAAIPGFNNSYDAKTNLPARLRLALLFAYGQTIGAMVANTCNASEDAVGYATFFGDNGGSFAPIAKLTTEEIINLGKELGLPAEFVEKTPVDGLQPLSDEEKLGFTYGEVNELIRDGKRNANYNQIVDMYMKNKFKTEIVNIPAFEPGLPNYITGENATNEVLDDNAPARFRKKPVAIEAIRWTGNNFDAVKKFAGDNVRIENGELVVVTLEDGKEGQAKHAATVGDYVIKGVQGEFYFCKPDIFAATYDLD